jgi:glycosyltransferase involved in cell wall biosynthesis
MNPRLSVITVNLNNSKGLEKTIHSVIEQDFQRFEYIIVDGGSTDESVEVIRSYTDIPPDKYTPNDISQTPKGSKLSPITYWISEPDAGIYQAMNKGIMMAKGQYCLFLNSSDWLVNGILKQAFNVPFSEDIVYFNSYLYYDESKIDELNYPFELSMRYFFSATIGHQATLIKKDMFKKIGLYDENKKIHSDYDFWIKAIILNNCTVKHIPKYFSYYDMNGLSSRPNKFSSAEKQHLLNKYFPQRIISDYKFWATREKDMAIAMWYRNHRVFYPVLVFLYKIIKNIKKLIKTN